LTISKDRNLGGRGPAQSDSGKGKRVKSSGLNASRPSVYPIPKRPNAYWKGSAGEERTAGKTGTVLKTQKGAKIFGFGSMEKGRINSGLSEVRGGGRFCKRLSVKGGGRTRGQELSLNGAYA